MKLQIMIRKLINFFHVHKWETTHTNQWYHPTRQRCRCGLSRQFKFKDGHEKMKCMSWDAGEWAWSNGNKSKYSVSD